LREEESKSRKRQKPDEAIAAAQTNGRPTWSGTISFGLVSIPVNLFPATRDSRIALRTLGPEGEPLKRDFYAPDTGHDLEEAETVRGFETDGKVVTVTEEELERLAPEKSRDINLRVFVARSEISPMYFERAYILTPADKSGKAYRLLAEIMEYSQRVGIATFVMRGKEYLVAILARGGILRAETMRFSDEVRSPSDLDAAFEAVAVARPSTLITLPDGMLLANRTRIVEFTKRSQLPALFPDREFAEAGGLMAYGPSLAANFRGAATYVDKILKGTKPADLPVEQPTKFELVINLKTARALGLTIPQSVLLRADQLIE